MRLFRVAALHAVLAGCLAVSSAGQEVLDYGVTGGLTRSVIGGGFADLVQDVGGSIDPRYGITLGGYATWSVKDAFQLVSELTLTQKGVRIPPENGVKRRDLDFTYIDLAGIVVRPFPGETYTPWIGAGPVLSFKVAADGRVGDNSFDASDEFTGTDFGVGVDGGVAKGALRVGVRYVLGLKNVSTQSGENEDGSNRSFMLKVSYSLKK